MAWRYLATRLNGDGTETFLSYDVPLGDVALVDDLSGPGGVSGILTPEQEHLIGSDGVPVFQPWSTAIYAEKDGSIRAGAILADLGENGPKLDVEAVGFNGYLNGQPYTFDAYWMQADPLDLARHLWEHKQEAVGGNLGIQLDSTTSPVRVGLPESPVKWGNVTAEMWDQLKALGWRGDPADGEEQLHQPAGQEPAGGLYRLSWWVNHDLGKEFNDLALNTPFDYVVEHTWEGDRIAHRLRLGYPHLGSRRTDLRFVVGENVTIPPAVDYSGEDYASEVVVLGAGEGRQMVRGSASRATGRLHRGVVVQDKTITSESAARAAAERELQERLGDADISELTVVDHPHAPLGAVQVGDEIYVQSPKGWTRDLNLWVRVLSIRIEPAKDTSTLTVARVEKVK